MSKLEISTEDAYRFCYERGARLLEIQTEDQFYFLMIILGRLLVVGGKETSQEK